MLDITGLTTGYGEAAVLHGIDLAVPAGAIVALVGANGAGKTTLAKAISGLLPAREGEIRLAGRRIERLSSGARLRLGIAQVPEGRQIIAGLTVAENLALGAFTQRAQLGAAGIARRAAALAERFPVLRERRDAPAGTLSGGQQQMLAIARALMSAPRLLVLDEPSLGLAPALVGEIFRLVGELRGQGLAILLSEQNARLSLAIADYGYVIEMGRVTLQGSGAELLATPEIAERYLGMGRAGDAASGPERDERHRRLVDGLARIMAG